METEGIALAGAAAAAGEEGAEEQNDILTATADQDMARQEKIQNLFHAAEFGDYEKLKDFFTENEIPLEQMVNKFGSNPLHLAAWKGHGNCCEFLIEKGMDINLPNNELTTPLHCAAERGHYDILKLLLETGANVNAVDKYGYTPLHYSNRNGHHIGSILLIDHGADTTIKNNICPNICQHGETPLDVTEIFSLREAIHNEELKRYSDHIKSRIESASPIRITGTSEIEGGRYEGIYTPKYTQCGWPVYCNNETPTIRLSYFGDEHHGQWRIQDLHPPSSNSINLIPIFKISIHSPVFPHEIPVSYPKSQWLVRVPEPPPSIWSMIMTQRERYEAIPSLTVQEV